MIDKKLKESYGTLSETINALIQLGYTYDFNIMDDKLASRITDNALSPYDFQVDHVFRFEGESDPEYQSILYAISATKNDLKGILVNGYGPASDETADKLIKKLKTHTDQNIMETKSNDATQLRPEGERILNAPLVEMDLNVFIQQIKSESTWTDSDRNSITIFKSDTMRILLIGLHENAELKPHKANGVISVQVLAGKIAFNAGQQTTYLETGQMVALQDNITHSVKAVTESFFLLTLAIKDK